MKTEGQFVSGGELITESINNDECVRRRIAESTIHNHYRQQLKKAKINQHREKAPVNNNIVGNKIYKIIPISISVCGSDLPELLCDEHILVYNASLGKGVELLRLSTGEILNYPYGALKNMIEEA